jgi:hypothetical protein
MFPQLLKKLLNITKKKNNFSINQSQNRSCTQSQIAHAMDELAVHVASLI